MPAKRWTGPTTIDSTIQKHVRVGDLPKRRPRLLLPPEQTVKYASEWVSWRVGERVGERVRQRRGKNDATIVSQNLTS